MLTTHETGHAKNLTALKGIIDCCVGFGKAYAPTNPRFTLSYLTTLHASAEAMLQTLKNARADYNQAVANRQVVFARLKPLAARAIDMLPASGASTDTIYDAREYLNKLLGKRNRAMGKKKLKKKPAPANVGSALGASRFIPLSQQSFDKQAENFAQFVATLTADPRYKPLEDDFELTALGALLRDLRAANASVVASYEEWGQARMMRDQLFDIPVTGLVDVCLDVKMYVKSAFGGSSAEFKQISQLKFRRQSLWARR